MEAKKEEEKPVEDNVVDEKVSEAEKKKDEKRRRHVRPWDKGKEGVKQHREYTQEEWVEKKRRERPEEFAPPTAFQKRSKTKTDRDSSEVYENKSLYFSTKKSADSNRNINPYKRNIVPETRTPIVNELSDDDSVYDKEMRTSDPDSDDERRGKGVEVAPPPTFDYYGPSSSKRHRVDRKKENIEDSITAGLNYLREQTEQKQKSHKRDNDMFIM